MQFPPINLWSIPKQWGDYIMNHVWDWGDDEDKAVYVGLEMAEERSNHAKAMSEARPSAIEQTLKERGERYGKFDSHARITQNIKSAMYVGGWHDLNSSQKEALEMIAHKIGRIINGDPNYEDSWHDIAGYAKLVEDQLIK